MQNVEMTKVEFEENYQMHIRLSNGHEILYNLKPRVNTARFRELENEEIYWKGRLEKDGMIRWPGGIELSIDEVLITVSYNRT